MRKQCFSLITACVFSMFFAAGPAEASNGTLVLTFKHKESDGTVVPLSNAYIYLRDGGSVPPMEEHFSRPGQIFGPTDSAGFISVDVPAGKYYVRVTRRNQLETKARPLGPPEPNDYSWNTFIPITINPGTVTNLGTQYAAKFKQNAVVTGIVTDTSGQPMPGRYVRAQTVPCIIGNEVTYPNYCGPVKLPSQQRTDVNGRYTIHIREPGAYYIVTSKTLGDNNRTYGSGWLGNPSTTGYGMGPVSISAGSQVTVNMKVPNNL
jgi:hypothetical protein